MLAVKGGISVWSAIIISMTNLTSAGQFAGMNLITAGAGLTEIGITTLVINLRYMLMSLALSQKIEKMPLIKRMIISIGITDEIFTIASTKRGKVGFQFMLGLIAVPYIGWTLGTVLGAFTNNILPPSLVSAMGITLYAMFIAIFIPPAKRDNGILAVLIFAVAISCVFYYGVKGLSSGWATIITAIAASAFGAVFFPKKEDSM
jgi:predicted branched-subunit amino acid permease